MLAVVALAGFGTLLPFTLFAFGQSRVPAQVAGAFLNLEPLVGALVGAAAFGDAVGVVQVAGGAAILAGIGLSSLPLLAGRRRRVAGGSRVWALVLVLVLVLRVWPWVPEGETAEVHECDYVPNREVSDRSHIRSAGPARRLVIEAGYPL